MSEITTQTEQTQQTEQTEKKPDQSALVIDYDKIAEVVAGKQKVAEEAVLKSFFKNQGLSAEEMTAAIDAYKANKQKNNPEAVNA